MRKIKEENLLVNSVSYIINKFGKSNTNTLQNLLKSAKTKGTFDQAKDRQGLKIIQKNRELSAV